MDQQAVEQAVMEIITAFGADRNDRDLAKATSSKVLKRKELKDAFAPIASLLKRAPRAEQVLQGCLEQPEDHVLHGAAAALVKAGTIPWVQWLAHAPGAQPKRSVVRLQLAGKRPEVYALETGPCVSVWSLETGEHLRDLKLPGRKGSMVTTLAELPDGTLRALSSEGTLSECPPGGKAFKAVHELELQRTHQHTIRSGCASDPQLNHVVTQVAIEPVEIDGRPQQRLRIFDVAARTTRELVLPFAQTDEHYLYQDGVVLMGARNPRPQPPEGEPWFDDCSLVELDVAKATTRILPLKGELIGGPVSIGTAGAVGVQLRTVEFATDPVWLLMLNGAQAGPSSIAQLQAQVSQGLIRPETLAWREGFEEWKPVRDVPELVNPLLEGGFTFCSLDLGTGATRAIPPPEDQGLGPALPDGSYYGWNLFYRFTAPEAVAPAFGVARPFVNVGAYALPEEPSHVVYAVDALRGQVVVAGMDPPTPVRVIAPFSWGKRSGS